MNAEMPKAFAAIGFINATETMQKSLTSLIKKGLYSTKPVFKKPRNP
jgi:hypothetical protein